MNRSEAFEKVASVLAQLLSDKGVEPSDITMDSSLVRDLGFESFLFVDLSLSLEKVFGIDAFPMQDWADEQIDLGDRAFLVTSLVDWSLRATAVRGNPQPSGDRRPTIAGAGGSHGAP